MKVLLAGASGYLGSHILEELLKRNIPTIALVRKGKKIQAENNPVCEVVEAEVTQPKTLTRIFKGVDVVISAVGITRQKDGLTYRDVDYQANVNLLESAIAQGVKRFVYVASLDGEKMQHLKICAAKEQFVRHLKQSSVDYCIVRPNGFYSDLGEFMLMANKGRVYLFGKGLFKLNPIDGADLATEIVNILNTSKTELVIGGPEVFSHHELVQLISRISGKKVKITYVPAWIKHFILFFLRRFTSSKTYGPVEFFLTTLSRDMVAPRYGSGKIEDYFIKFRNDNASLFHP